jgi:hypothetical protein
MPPKKSEISQAVLVLAYEMLVAGVDQLKLYDPETENPMDAGARIYAAMELARVYLENEMMMFGTEEKPTVLN